MKNNAVGSPVQFNINKKKTKYIYEINYMLGKGKVSKH